jgi:hypothetical protein
LPQLKTDAYRPLTRRRRVLLALMAIVVACTVIPYMVRHYGMVKAFQAAHDSAPAVPVCTAGQSDGCVGGRVEVLKPPKPSASAAR